MTKREFPNTDSEGARCLLRAAAWIVGIRGAMETEDAIIDQLNEESHTEWSKEHKTSLLEKISGPEPACMAMLQLVEALIRRRVSNCRKLQHAFDVVIRIFSFRGSARVRATVVSTMAWGSRCPRTRQFLFDRYDADHLKPIKTASKDYARILSIDPWEVEVMDDYERETGICIGDGGVQSGIYNVNTKFYNR